MAYPGLALAVMVGVGLGVALYYFFTDTTPPQAHQGHGHRRGPDRDDAPNNTWVPPENPNSRRRRRSQSSAKDADKQQECVICFEPLQNSTTRELKCHHRFHSGCINKWIETQSSCPICRRIP